MATPTQTTAAVKADNVGANPTVAAGLTFQAGRDVVLHVGHFSSGSSITAVSIGGTAGALIGRRIYSADTRLRVEEWLIKGVGSNSSNVVFTVSGSGHYITIVGREFPASTFGDIDAAAEGGAEGSATSLTVTTAASIAQASSVLFATFGPYETANPVGLTGITGYSDVVEQEDGVNSQGILCGWLETTTTGSKSATATQASNFPWAGSLGVVKLGGGGGGGLVVNPLTGRGGAAARPLAA